jgi:hypothetical protein
MGVPQLLAHVLSRTVRAIGLALWILPEASLSSSTCHNNHNQRSTISCSACIVSYRIASHRVVSQCCYSTSVQLRVHVRLSNNLCESYCVVSYCIVPYCITSFRAGRVPMVVLLLLNDRSPRVALSRHYNTVLTFEGNIRHRKVGIRSSSCWNGSH